MGCSTPISLLAYMMLIRMVLSVIASRKLIQIHQAVLLNRQIGDAHAVFFEALAGVEDGFVLRGGGDDVVAFFGIHLGDAFEGQVVRIRSRRW